MAKGCGALALLGGIGALGLLVVALLIGIGVGGWWLWETRFKMGKTELVTAELDPDADQEQVVAHEDQISVRVPFGAIQQKQTLKISSIGKPPAAADASQLGAVYDVSTSGSGKFDEELEISINLDQCALGEGGRRGPAFRAVYYDEQAKQWTEVPAVLEPKTGKLRIYSDHLSMFSSTITAAVPEITPMAKVPRPAYPCCFRFEDSSTVDQLLGGGTSAGARAGWDIAQEWFNIGGQVGTLGQEALGIGALSKINDIAGGLGLGFALIQVAVDVQAGDNLAAATNLTKNLSYYSVGKWGTSAMKIATVGVFAIDYSLNKFATAAIGGRYQIYERAYAGYYSQPGKKRKGRDWHQRFRKILSAGLEPEEASRRVRAEVDAYLWEFWSDQSNLAIGQDDNQTSAWSGAGGLSESVKKQIVANARHELMQFLGPVFTKLQRDMTREQTRKVHERLLRLAKELNRVHTVQVVVKSNDPERKLDGITALIQVDRDPDLWRGQTDALGKWNMRFTGLGYMQYGLPKKVKVEVPAEGGEKRILEKDFELKPGTTVVEIDLDGLAGHYTGTISTQVSGRGIDGTANLNGTVTIDVAEDGSANMTFKLPLKVSFGGGAAGMKGTANGKLKGKVEGTTFTASGTAASSFSLKVSVPGATGPRGGSQTAPVTAQGTAAVASGGATINGTVKSPRGGAALKFKAQRKE